MVEHLQRRDTVHSDALTRLAATLDAPPPRGIVPPLWHWTSFLDRTPRHHLGPDGHPRSGGLVENPPYPRRMFAGGRIRVIAPMPVDLPVDRRTTVGDVVHKEGRQGPLAFVTIAHACTVNGVAVAEEEQDLVYRPAVTSLSQASSSVPSSTPARGSDGDPGLIREADLRGVRTFDEVHLFRFSALTFNSHRIHYDAPYARDVEGYPGLVVQGPLLIISLLELVRDRFGSEAVASVEFRALAPVFAHQQIEFAGHVDAGDAPAGVRLVAGRGDQRIMEAKVVLRRDAA